VGEEKNQTGLHKNDHNWPTHMLCQEAIYTSHHMMWHKHCTKPKG